MTDDLSDFKQFMQQREAAARAYVRGEAAPLGALVTHHSPATFFAPRGGVRQGADDVWATYDHDAALFAPESETSFEILDMAASDGVAYWVGFQRASVRMRGSSAARQMNLRITELFRREDGAWKLVHRHADSLTAEPDAPPT